MHSEDGFIIQKCLNGESEAFGLLVDKYKASIYAFVYAKLHNFHDSEDVTQETFIKAYQKLRDLRKWDSFLAWLYCIASDKCRKFIRSQASRPDSEFIEDQKFKDNWTDTNSENDYDSLHDALDSLPDIYREVLTLHYLGGMSTNQIANFLRVSPESIRQRLSRARTQLKEEVLAMMSGTLTQHKLQAGFTFRVVEILKKIKINPVSNTTNLPWGISLATGILFTFLSFGSHLFQIDLIGSFPSSPLPVESKVLKVGEIPVDVIKTSNIAIISSQIEKGKGGESKQNTFFMAPQGQGQGKWTEKADMPISRVGFAAGSVNGKIYVIGGLSGGFATLQTVEEYDPKADKWVRKTNMPTARIYLSASVVNEKIYVIGGSLPFQSGLQTVEEYDPAKDEWTKKADMPTPRFALSTCELNGKIYAIGGSNKWGTSIATVEEYDPAKDEWTTKANMPTSRYLLNTFSLNGKIYAFGGNWGDGLISKVEEYDPVADKWTNKKDMSFARDACGVSIVDGKVYVIGGTGLSWAAVSLVEEYDPVADIWTKKADMLTPRSTFCTGEVDGKIYAMGGESGMLGAVMLASVEEFDIGFVPPKNVEAKGKLPKTWGTLKAK